MIINRTSYIFKRFTWKFKINFLGIAFKNINRELNIYFIWVGSEAERYNKNNELLQISQNRLDCFAMILSRLWNKKKVFLTQANSCVFFRVTKNINILNTPSRCLFSAFLLSVLSTIIFSNGEEDETAKRF